MSGPSTYIPKSALGRWFESRLPIMGLVHSSFIVLLSLPEPLSVSCAAGTSGGRKAAYV